MTIITKLSNERLSEVENIEIPKGQRFVVTANMSEYDGLEVDMVVNTGRRNRIIEKIYEVYTDSCVKEIWVDTVSTSNLVTTVGIKTAKKYRVLGK